MGIVEVPMVINANPKKIGITSSLIMITAISFLRIAMALSNFEE